MMETEDIGKPERDILRLRAEARGLLQDPSQGPRLITQYVSALRDADGRLLGPDLNFTRAEVGGRVFERGENETLAAFEARVDAEMPAIGVGQAAFWSDDDPRVLTLTGGRGKFLDEENLYR